MTRSAIAHSSKEQCIRGFGRRTASSACGQGYKLAPEGAQRVHTCCTGSSHLAIGGRWLIAPSGGAVHHRRIRLQLHTFAETIVKTPATIGASGKCATSFSTNEARMRKSWSVNL